MAAVAAGGAAPIPIRVLCKAARSGDMETAERILTIFPEALNLRNRDGRTPLIIAVRHSRVDVVKFLLDFGAEVNKPSDRSGASPIWHAAWKGDVKVTSVLLENGADSLREAQDCGTPLMVAAQYGHYDVVERLLDHGVEIDHMQQRYLCTALWWGCRSNKEDVVRLLLQRGADFTLLDWKGRTAFEVAIQKHHHGCCTAIAEAMRALTLFKIRTIYDARQCLDLLPRSRTRRSTQQSRSSHLPTCLKERIQQASSSSSGNDSSSSSNSRGRGGGKEVGSDNNARLPDARIEPIVMRERKKERTKGAGAAGGTSDEETITAVTQYVTAELTHELFHELMDLMR